MKIVDSAGNPIVGMTRGLHGVISINNKSEYDRYMREKAMVGEIESLTDRIDRLESILNTLIIVENK
jgi:hypothetical protein